MANWLARAQGIAARPAHANDAMRPVVTPEQATELRALLALILANDSDADRAEALAVALADPEAALISFRALAADLRPAPLPDPDDRRTCQQCANLSQGGRCLAAWRGERMGMHGRDYRPIADLPGRCVGYAPGPNDPDRRTGAERWASVMERKT